MQIKISEIKIKNRVRIDKGDIKDLANSLTNVGQLNPIIIDENSVLIAGERRLLAAKSLNWETIEAKIESDLSDIEKLIIEREENLHRKDLTWDERLKSTEELHKLQVSVHGKAKPHVGGGWSIKKTAEMLNQAEGKVVQDLNLAKAIKTDKELLAKPTKQAALSEMKKKKELTERKILALLSIQDQKYTPNKTETEAYADANKAFMLGNIQVLYGECLSHLQTLKDESVDCIFTDPPYTVGYDKSTGDTRRNKWKHLAPDDNANMLEDVIKPAMKECHRLLRPGCHGYMFCSGNMFQEVKQMLLQCKFFVCSSPLIWYKPHVFFAHNPYKTYKYDYEFCVLFSKGQRKDLIQPAWAVWKGRLGPGERGLHPNRKPVELAKRWIQNSTIENELVIDPFGGSCVTAEACLAINRRCITIEKDIKWWAMGITRLKEKTGENSKNETN